METTIKDHTITVLIGVLMALVANSDESGRFKLKGEGFVLGAFSGRCVELKCAECILAHGLWAETDQLACDSTRAFP